MLGSVINSVNSMLMVEIIEDNVGACSVIVIIWAIAEVC